MLYSRQTIEKKKEKFITIFYLFETEKNNELLILDVKSCLVDYNHYPEENMSFYVEKENQHK